MTLAPVAVVLLIAAGCASHGGDVAGDRDTSTTDTIAIETSTTIATATTSTSSPTTTETTTTMAAPTQPVVTTPVPGAPCDVGSHPDCIDPDGDGQGVYLLFGSDCMESFPDAPSLCEDLDHDGIAGYPDRG